MLKHRILRIQILMVSFSTPQGCREDGTDSTPARKIDLTHKDTCKNDGQIGGIVGHDNQHQHVSDGDDEGGEDGS